MSPSPAWALALAAILAPPVQAATVVLGAEKDNTLYEGADLSNGQGDHMFTGRTNNDESRRALLQFPVAGNLPPGSVVESVTLELYMSRAESGAARATALHRALASWGEGASDAMGEEGGGAPAAEGDATWIHRFFPEVTWNEAGGDFVAQASGTASVGGIGAYSWSGSGMVADVQAWLDAPSGNFGWAIRGVESLSSTSKRFDSRTHPDPDRRPRLIIDYTPSGVPAGVCCIPGEPCILLRPADCAAAGGDYLGDGTTCMTSPCEGLPMTVVFEPSRDNTLYEEATGALSNGAGKYFFAGRTAAPQIRRRAVFAFDLGGVIPPGAVVSSAELTLRNTNGPGVAHNASIHRLLADWGEGASDAPGEEWDGAPSAPGDATWIHRFYPTDFWTTPGGDHAPTASATSYVAFEEFYHWSSPTMVADIQAWVDDPATNFGWMLIGNETLSAQTQKRYVSRESADLGYRPKLEVTFSVPPPDPTGPCCLPDGHCAILTALECAQAGGTYEGDDQPCSPEICELVLEPYVDPLPLPAVAVPTSGVPGGAASYEIDVVEVVQQLHRDLPPTRLWTYEGQYPGPTIEAAVDEPVSVTWISDLRDSTGALRADHLLPVDHCLHGTGHMAQPRTVVHLHGGHVPEESDGYPEHTILPGEQQTFFYPNHQEPSLLWYHDHALGITRLNVLLGLAGLYVIRDEAEASLALPSGAYEVPLVLADRTFAPDGSFRYPAHWEEHFFGDKTLVNGKVWPYLEVDQGAYRFRILNGANARTYRLSLSNGAPFVVLGGDGGLLPAPVLRDSLLLAPAERVDVVVDFSASPAGAEILLVNSAPAPFPSENPMHPQVPEVMKFVVTGTPGYDWTGPDSLRAIEILREEDATVARDFVLQRFPDECTGAVWKINGLRWDDVTEFPLLGATETWRFINRSGMVHPMHMHLVMFQVLDIQPFMAVGDSIVPTGPPVPPDAAMAGWKDTVPVLPGEMVRVIARFEDYAGLYPYHCHILEHEDHDMMRQFRVLDASGAPEVPIAGGLEVWPPRPNPGSGNFDLRFRTPLSARVQVEMFDVAGRRVASLLDGLLPAGAHSLTWNGRDAEGRPLPSGVYRYRVSMPDRAAMSGSLLLVR